MRLGTLAVVRLESPLAHGSLHDIEGDGEISAPTVRGTRVRVKSPPIRWPTAPNGIGSLINASAGGNDTRTAHYESVTASQPAVQNLVDKQ
jgi:hypothetical protein